MHIAVKSQDSTDRALYTATMHACIGQDVVPIGDTVREMRRQRGWTQAQLAEKAGVSQGQVSRLESGETLNPSHDTLARIAEAFTVPLAELIGRATNPTPRSDVGRIPVPVVQVPAHAGVDWTWEPTGQVVTIDEDSARGRNLQAIRVEGDCMIPAVDPGDLLIFDRWSRHPQDGHLVVVSRDSQIHVRWARRDPKTGMLSLVDNFGRPFPLDTQTTLEGIVIERRTHRPRRRGWHDLDLK